MHSAYCDGVGNLSDYLDQAAATGVHYAGFSSHAPVPFNCKWCMRKEYLPTYLSNIESLKPLYPTIQLYKGLEIDFAPGIISPADFRDQLDYTIGSIHFVGNLADGRPWEIDGPHELFMEGLQSIFNNNIRLAITRYYELTREMITTSRPDIIGHLDKIKIQNPGEKFFRETDEWYREEIIRTLDEIARAGSVVEVNTRGIYQKKSTTTYPSPWVLELIHKRNIPVTLSSDAHKPLDIINQFSETARLLIAIGFKKISILKDKTWQPVILTENGIIP
jgi:histidinol-phosphatase (PHP family)